MYVCFDSNHEMYLLGSHERLTLDVNVFNAHEDAFEALFYLDLPRGTSLLLLYSLTKHITDQCFGLSFIINRYSHYVGIYILVLCWY